MIQYLDLLKRVMDHGTLQQNRTGIAAKRLTGAMLEFNLADGFPVVTTKRLAFGAVKGELLGFIRGYMNASQFRKLGCNVWDQNANENREWLDNPNRIGYDDLGRIYGAQWRCFEGVDGFVDQLRRLLTLIEIDPTNRRMIVNAWNPTELSKMALPPCHVMWQILIDVERHEISMVMYQRSCDMFLGIPFNIASYALLLEMLAKVSGYKAGKLCMMLADVHIYENHFDQVNTQMAREPLTPPKLMLEIPHAHRYIDRLELIEPHHIQLVGYTSHLPIKGAMAV